MEIGTKALLEIRGLTKSFPGVKALQDVDFTVRRGEVHGLMGENGAGKSTLIKVLTGVYPRDGGTIRFDGAEIDPRSPKAVEALGVSTVYQEVNLIPHRSVAENICLGRQPTRFGMIRWRAVVRRAETALARVDLRLDVSQPLSGLLDRRSAADRDRPRPGYLGKACWSSTSRPPASTNKRSQNSSRLFASYGPREWASSSSPTFWIRFMRFPIGSPFCVMAGWSATTRRQSCPRWSL